MGERSMTTSQAQPSDTSEGEVEREIPTGEAEAMAALAEAFKLQHETPSLEDRVVELEAKAAEYHDAALRAAAELENTRKRAERDRLEASKYAVAGFARDLVSVYENLSRASASIPAEARATDANLNTLALGVEMTLGELSRAFEKHHIQRLDPMGEMFDHNFHQAMMKMETTDHPAGTVVQVMQAAYVLHDRLLQPAFVGVATAPASSATVVHHVDTQA
jgi:molecular chaperone GrpE